MNVLRLIQRSFQQRPLSSALTALSVGLGVMLVVAIVNLRADLEEHFLRPGKGFSMVVGPKGSPLQLVLNAIYHLDDSPGLMPVTAYFELEKNPGTRLAIPYAVGDSFRGHRVVGTTSDVFSPAFPHPKAQTSEEKFASGRAFGYKRAAFEHALDDMRAFAATGLAHHHHHDDDIAEAVLGAEVAERLGIAVGAQIEPTHGVEGEKAHQHAHLWTVVGILKKSYTPLDRVVLINIDSFYRIADHAGGVIPETKEPGLSAVLLFPKPGYAKAALLPALRKRTDIQVAEVWTEVRNLFKIVGNVDQILFIISLLVVAIGVASVMVAIYNTMNERRREFAIQRAIGARATTLLLTVVLESALIGLIGAVIGLLLGHGLLAVLGNYVAETAGFRPESLRFLPAEFLVVGLVALASAVAGLVPALKAYKTDVAANLAPLS